MPEISEEMIKATVFSFLSLYLSVKDRHDCPPAVDAELAMRPIAHEVRDMVNPDTMTLDISDRYFLDLRSRMRQVVMNWIRGIQRCEQIDCPDKDNPSVRTILADMSIDNFIEEIERKRPESTVLASIGRWN